MTTQDDQAILDVRDLRVSFTTAAGEVEAVHGIDFSVRRGEVLAIVGESGSGKTVSMMSILQLLPPGTRYSVTGSAQFDGLELIGVDVAALNQIRGRKVAVVFQDALGAFNPVRRVGPQIAEMAHRGGNVERRDAKQRAIELLQLVGMSEPERRYSQFPHELSGGMRQRALIAVALAAEPDLLIADEPTTALDVTVQAQIIELLAGLVSRLQMSTIVISHDLGVVAGIADRVAVMYRGEIVETGDVEDVLLRPQHQYTRRLLSALEGEVDESGRLDEEAHNEEETVR
ncbi:ABC transporter ATP-binding protein [Microbacterium sp. SA39]|uniref:ABC transporter ATP-binding protein n=1 Tax=Microbacterium sp. SA39 TaxID=1263625 RepID=UPI00061E6728|nr:ABC transporter ATP-binding protein [Microbacterium sp. SA39]KJQ52757.1 Oligopeptide transport ATP-binding protein OppD [Microbacterium sp. SA39]